MAGTVAAEPLTTILIPASQLGPEDDLALQQALDSALGDSELELVDGFQIAEAALLGGRKKAVRDSARPRARLATR